MHFTNPGAAQLLLNPGDINQKLREIELQLLDFKSKTERRFTNIIEEVPSKLEREMKRIEVKGQES